MKKAEMKQANLTVSDEKKSKSVLDHPLDAFELFNALTIDRMGLLLTSSASVRKETQFIASTNVKAMKELLEGKLRELNAKVTPKNEYGYKCLYQKGTTAVQFYIDITPIYGDICHVIFRRGKGEILDYNSMYNNLISKLQTAKVIVKPKKTI